MHFTQVVLIAQKAWDATKDKSDPVWNDCDPAHRQKFAAAAQAVIDSGHAVNDFEHAVKRLAREAEAGREVVAEVQAEQPTAHSDEIQLEAAKRQAAEGVHVAESAAPRIEGNTFTETPATGDDASADAKTLRNSKPTPEDDKAVSAAAKRLSGRKSSSKKSAKKGK